MAPLERVRERHDEENDRVMTVDADEQQWDEQFAASQDVLATLAAEALADFNAGRTEPLDPDRL